MGCVIPVLLLLRHGGKGNEIIGLVFRVEWDSFVYFPFECAFLNFADQSGKFHIEADGGLCGIDPEDLGFGLSVH